MFTYPEFTLIDKACNGSFMLYHNLWYRVIWVDWIDNPVYWERGIFSIEYDNHRYYMTKKAFNLSWIESLKVNTFQADW